MAQIYDRVRESASRNVGAGFGTDIFLGGPVIGHRSFSDAGIPNGTEVTFTVVDGDNFEIGTANYNAGANRLENVQFRDKSDPDASPTLSVEAQVYIAARPEDFRITPDLYAGMAYNVDNFQVFDDAVVPFQDSFDYSGNVLFARNFLLSESDLSSSGFLDLANAKDTYREVNSILPNSYNGIQVSADGRFLFALDEVEHKLYKFTLETRYDISSVNLSLVQAFSEPDLESMNAIAFALNSTGTELIFAGTDSFDGDVRLREYSLTTPYDLSRATSARINNVSETLGVPSAPPTSISYNNNNNFLVLVVSGDIFVIRHESSFSNATLEDSGFFPFATRDAWFDDAGLNALYVTVDNEVRKATLSSPFDISTASDQGIAYTVPGVGTHAFITATPDGDRMYVSDTDGADTREVHLPEAKETYGPGIRVNRDGIYKVSLTLAWSTDTVSIGDGIFFEIQKSASSGGPESDNLVDDEARVVSAFGSASGEEANIRNVLIVELQKNDTIYVRLTSVGSSEATVDYGSLIVRLIESTD